MGSMPITQPSGNPGLAAAALAKLREAIHIIEQCLPDLPPGKVHESAVNAIKSLSMHANSEGAMPGVQNTAIKDMQAESDSNGPLQALMRQLQGGAGGAPGGDDGGPPLPGPADQPGIQ